MGFAMAIGITATLGNSGWVFAIAVGAVVFFAGLIGKVVKSWIVWLYLITFSGVFLFTILSPFGVWLRELVGV